MNTVLIGFAIAAFVLLLNRKNGPFGVFEKLRAILGKPVSCSVCLAWWMWLFLSPFMIGRISILNVVYYAGALGVAYLVLAIAGALDLDS